MSWTITMEDVQTNAAGILPVQHWGAWLHCQGHGVHGYVPDTGEAGIPLRYILADWHSENAQGHLVIVDHFTSTKDGSSPEFQKGLKAK